MLTNWQIWAYFTFCQSYFWKSVLIFSDTSYLSYFMKSYLSISTSKYAYKKYLHLLLHKPVVIENIVHLNRTSRETSCWKTGALKRAVSRVSVKETGVRPSTLACNLVLFVCHNSVIIHITIALSLKKHKQTTEVK